MDSGCSLTPFTDIPQKSLTAAAAAAGLPTLCRKASDYTVCRVTLRFTGNKRIVSPAIKTQQYAVGRNVALLILALTISWRSVANLTPRPL